VTKSKIFFLLSIAFIGGVFGASFYYPNLTNNFFLQLLILLGIIILTVFYKKPAMMAGFFIIFLALGIYWTNISLTEIKDHSEGKNFSGLVQVVKEPEMKGRYQDLTVKAENNEKFLALAGIFPEYNYGDVLKVDCKLEISMKLLITKCIWPKTEFIIYAIIRK